MTDPAATFADDMESRRITAVVQRAADAAFQARVAQAIDRRFTSAQELAQARRNAGFVEGRWQELSQSTRQTRSAQEFGQFAQVLSVSPRWLATGAGSPLDPPAGWSAFGTHVESADVVPLEFSTEVDGGLMPLWERPRSEVLA